MIVTCKSKYDEGYERLDLFHDVVKHFSVQIREGTEPWREKMIDMAQGDEKMN